MTTVTQTMPLDQILKCLTALCREHYGKRLVSLAVFGSVGRGTPRPDSDVDFLLVVEDLPNGRMARSAKFAAVESSLAPDLAALTKIGLHPELSPIFKTPAEIQQGSPLLLDMTDDAHILYDRGDFLRRELQKFSQKLKKLGAQRVWQGNAWYWDLKPDYKRGEIIEL